MMVVKSTNLTVYARGTVWMAKNYNRETEGLQSGNRPFLIISNNERGPSKIVEGLWISSQEKPPIKINVKFTNHVGQVNTVLCNQHDTLKVEDLIKYMGTLSDSKMREVEVAMMYAQGLERYADLGSRLDKLEILLGAIKDERVEAFLDGFRDESVAISKKIEDLESRLDTACKEHEKSMESSKETIQPSTKKSKKSRVLWTEERMKDFIKDYEGLGIQETADKWNLSEKSVASMAYHFRKKFNNNPRGKYSVSTSSDDTPKKSLTEDIYARNFVNYMKRFIKDKEELTMEEMQETYNMDPKTICKTYYEYKAKLEG